MVLVPSVAVRLTVFGELVSEFQVQVEELSVSVKQTSSGLPESEKLTETEAELVYEAPDAILTDPLDGAERSAVNCVDDGT